MSVSLNNLESIMIDDRCTKMRNEIMRNIKLHQMKEKNLPNFIRKKREEFLSRVRATYVHNNRGGNLMMSTF